VAQRSEDDVAIVAVRCHPQDTAGEPRGGALVLDRALR
jgi:hypothetical protein